VSKRLEAGRGDELRIICPLCKTTWSTTALPCECPECGASVTVRATKLKPEQDNTR